LEEAVAARFEEGDEAKEARQQEASKASFEARRKVPLTRVPILRTDL
jgi:hypothetical protein